MYRIYMLKITKCLWKKSKKKDLNIRHIVGIDWRTQHRKDSVLLKLIWFNAHPIKIPAKFFVDIDKIVFKFIWKFKGIRIAKTIFKK